MKLKVPGRKKNNETQPQGQVFDLTGNSAAVTMTAEPAPEKKKAGSRIKGVFQGRKASWKKPVRETPAPEPSFGLINNNEDAFSVSVRNAEPLIKRLDSEKEGIPWLGDLQLNLASAVIVMSLFALIFTAGEIPELIFFIIPGFLVFMLISMLDAFDGEKIKRIRLYIAAAGGVALIATLIIFRSYIGNGWAIIMGYLYDTAEMAQAYIYDRFHVGALGDEHPYRCMHFAAIWGSCLVGLLTALPPARFRRTVAMAVACFSMLAFAYYGIIPSWACIAVLAAALILLFATGSILSSVSVLLVVAILFGAITLLDPGENYTISRADEYFRDRFALSSSYLDSGESTPEDLTEMEEEMKDKQENQTDGGSEFITDHRWFVVITTVLLILAAVGVAVWLFMKRLRKRQKANRAGIDSTDPRTAIVAMFPYTVKWLQPAGIDVAGKAFETLVPMIKADISGKYAERYTDMYDLWKEAAYSDHEMTEDGRNEMDSFLKDTMSMVNERSDLNTKIVNTVKYAL